MSNILTVVCLSTVFHCHLSAIFLPPLPNSFYLSRYPANFLAFFCSLSSFCHLFATCLSFYFHLSSLKYVVTWCKKIKLFWKIISELVWVWLSIFAESECRTTKQCRVPWKVAEKSEFQIKVASRQMFVRALGDVAKNSKLSVIDGSYRGLGLPPPLLFGSLYSADFHRWFYGNIHGHLEKFVKWHWHIFWSFG